MGWLLAIGIGIWVGIEADNWQNLGIYALLGTAGLTLSDTVRYVRAKGPPPSIEAFKRLFVESVTFIFPLFLLVIAVVGVATFLIK